MSKIRDIASALGDQMDLWKQAAAILLVAEYGERFLDAQPEQIQLKLLEQKLEELKRANLI